MGIWPRKRKRKRQRRRTQCGYLYEYTRVGVCETQQKKRWMRRARAQTSWRRPRPHMEKRADSSHAQATKETAAGAFTGEKNSTRDTHQHRHTAQSVSKQKKTGASPLLRSYMQSSLWICKSTETVRRLEKLEQCAEAGGERSEPFWWSEQTKGWRECWFDFESCGGVEVWTKEVWTGILVWIGCAAVFWTATLVGLLWDL